MTISPLCPDPLDACSGIEVFTDADREPIESDEKEER